VVLAYRHEAYVARCIEGITAQQYPAQVRVILAEDAGGDATLSIAKGRLPANGKHLLYSNAANLGPAANFAKAVALCTAPLVAFCESDDFWICPDKLEMQARALLAHPQASLCYTNYVRTTADGTPDDAPVLGPQPDAFSLQHLLYDHGPSMNNLLVRRSALPARWPESFYRVANPDVFVLAAVLLRGYGVYVPVVAGAYRNHVGGIWSQRPAAEQQAIRLLTRLLVLRAYRPPQWRRHWWALYGMYKKVLNNLKRNHPALYRDYARRTGPWAMLG
jgi:glycosyltransferase involved in cell wall biosynthesis